MLKLFYTNINCLSAKDIEQYSYLLPVSMQTDIMRYRMSDDRKRSLLARLALRYCLLKTTSSDDLLYSWNRDSFNKPSIPGWYEFNISHAGRWVLFAYSNESVGVDIEPYQDIDYQHLCIYFHQDEQQYILSATDPQKAFYEVWVKKEAILKASGKGMAQGLNAFSCVQDSVIVNLERWIFYPLNIGTKDIAYVCSKKADHSVLPQELSIDLLIHYL